MKTYKKISLEYRMGKIARRQEFEDFELKFKECISKSAITTKFHGHAATGVAISKEMAQIMEQILARASSQRYFPINYYHLDYIYLICQYAIPSVCVSVCLSVGKFYIL